MTDKANNDNKKPITKLSMGTYLHDILQQTQGDLSRAVWWLGRQVNDLQAYPDYLSQPEVEQMEQYRLYLGIIEGVILQLEAISGNK